MLAHFCQADIFWQQDWQNFRDQTWQSPFRAGLDSLRLCARPSRQNPPAPKPDFPAVKSFNSDGRKTGLPQDPTRPDCAHRYARPRHRSITTAKFRHSAELNGTTKAALNSPLKER